MTEPSRAEDSARFREAMSQVVGAVHVVATGGPAGLAGATATAVTSVSDSPPSLLVCLNQSSSTLAHIRENGRFSVNVLAAADREIAEIFAGATGLNGESRFREGDGWRMEEGPPLLDGALTSFLCSLSATHPVGSHVVLIGLVERAIVGSKSTPLLYHRRDYRSI